MFEKVQKPQDNFLFNSTIFVFLYFIFLFFILLFVATDITVAGSLTTYTME